MSISFLLSFRPCRTRLCLACIVSIVFGLSLICEGPSGQYLKVHKHEILKFFLGQNQYLTVTGLRSRYWEQFISFEFKILEKLYFFRFRPEIRIFTISALTQHMWKQFFLWEQDLKNRALLLVPKLGYWLSFKNQSRKPRFSLAFLGSYFCPKQIFLNSMLLY